MRTLTTTTSTATAQTITSPGILVRIDFGIPIYLSSRGDITWNSLNWVSQDVSVSGISWDGTGSQKGTLSLGNADNLFGALILNDGVRGRPIQIWQFYNGAIAPNDPVQIFNGICDEVSEIGLAMIRIAISSQSVRAMTCPRTFINQASGFNHLPATGKVVTWGDQRYILQRAKNG